MENIEFKGTKGPWEVKDLFGNRIIVDSKTDNIIRIVDNEANAKLIAAAPILLAALQKITEMNYQNAEDQYGDRNKAKGWSCVTVAEAAIKKALE